MIKFFRKIRQKLLTENKFSKYLLYAIGEIILVVIGILIALQINNWNESKKLANTESIYLKRFIIELKQDTTYFSNEIKQSKKNNEIIKDFSTALNDEQSQDSTVIKLANNYFSQGWGMPSFKPSTSTFNDLSSTGNLNIIRNTSLRDEIVKTYSFYDKSEDSFKINYDWVTPIDAMLTAQYDVLKYDFNTGFLYKSQSSTEMANELRRDRDVYIRNASNHYWINQASIKNFIYQKDNSSNLLKKITDYLNED
jgi:hypothetical protein